MTCPAHDLAAVRGMLREEDVDAIQDICRSLPNVPVVADVGAGVGTTALAVWAIRPEAQIISVDHDAARLDEVRRLSGIPASWTAIESDSSEAAAIFPAETFDLLLLDTSHEYEDTMAELRAWLPHLRERAWVWCHDYLGEYPGCPRAIDEIVDEGLMSAYKTQGLGWLGRKA